MVSKTLEGKVIIITGASAGIGKALAKECASHGASIVLAARRKNRLDSIAAEILEKDGKVLAIKTDISREDDVKRMIRAAEERFGRIDVLVNNAGYGFINTLEKTTDEEMREIFNVNVLGLHYGCRAVIPVMKKQGSGHIINVGSIVGMVAVPLNGAYCATKFAVKGYTATLRMELAKYNIQVSLILPGPTGTEFQEVASNKSNMNTQLSHPFASQSAETVAKLIVKCIQKPKRRVITSPIMKLWLHLGLHFPKLTERILSFRQRE